MSQDMQPNVRLWHFLQDIYGAQSAMTRVEVEVEALRGGVHGTPHWAATAVRVYASSEQLLPDFEATRYWKEVLAAHPNLFSRCTTRQECLDQGCLYLDYGLDWPDVNEKVNSPLCFTIEELYLIVSQNERKRDAVGLTHITIPMTIRKKVVNLLLDCHLKWFTFSEQVPNECVLNVLDHHYDWLLTQIASIRESGLEDDDDERSWFRYKGILISYVGSQTYWYRIWTSAMEEEKEFDVRDLETWCGKEAHVKHIIKAAIESGELSPDAKFLHERSDEE